MAETCRPVTLQLSPVPKRAASGHTRKGIEAARCRSRRREVVWLSATYGDLCVDHAIRRRVLAEAETMEEFVDDDELRSAAFSVEQPREVQRADFDRVTSRP